MPLLKEELWSPDQVRNWFNKYRGRVVQKQRKERNRQIKYLVDYITQAANTPLKDAEDVYTLLKSRSNTNTFLLYSGSEIKEITPRSVIKLFNQLTIEERAKVIKDTNKKIKEKEKRLRDELIATGRLGVIKCKSCNDVIMCPTCTNNVLRGWESKKGTIALCYECGTLFECNTGKIISHFEGSPGVWGARALVVISRYQI